MTSLSHRGNNPKLLQHAQLVKVAPTGKPITVTGIETMQVSGGKIVEGWVEFDQLGMLQQLGVIPSMG